MSDIAIKSVIILIVICIFVFIFHKANECSDSGGFLSPSFNGYVCISTEALINE